MAWATWVNRCMVRCLVVALAILGSAFDAMPITWLANAGLCQRDGDDPFAPSREDERDETPDDASDLAWPRFQMIARDGRKARLRSHPLLLHACVFATERSDRRGSLRAPGRVGSDAPGVGLPIRLCRLTC